MSINRNSFLKSPKTKKRMLPKLREIKKSLKSKSKRSKIKRKRERKDISQIHKITRKNTIINIKMPIKHIIPLKLPDSLPNFAIRRMRYFNFEDNNLFLEWLKNRSTAIEERNRRQITLSCKPLYVDVEMNTICNLKCLFCPCTGIHTNKKLEFSHIDKLQFLFKYAEVVETSKTAEPFATPELFEYCLKKIREVNPFAIVHTVTNGTIMTKKLLESFIEYKLDHVYISLSAHNKELYQEVTTKNGFEQVVENIELINREKRNSKSKEPILHLNCQMSSYADPFEVLKIAHRLKIVEVNFIKTQPFSSTTESFKGKSIQDYMKPEEIEEYMNRIVKNANQLGITTNFSGWNTKNRRVCRPSVKYYYPSQTKFFDLNLTCPTDAPWFRFCTVMNHVSPCCWSNSYADWTKTPFEEMWNGEYLKNLRNQIKRDIYPSMCNCRY